MQCDLFILTTNAWAVGWADRTHFKALAIFFETMWFLTVTSFPTFYRCHSIRVIDEVIPSFVEGHVRSLLFRALLLLWNHFWRVWLLFNLWRNWLETRHLDSVFRAYEEFVKIFFTLRWGIYHPQLRLMIFFLWCVYKVAICHIINWIIWTRKTTTYTKSSTNSFIEGICSRK